MSGNKEGGRQAADTNRELHGPDFYRVIGARGGKAKNPNKGFGRSTEWASQCGKKGGTISRRPKKVVV